MVIQLNPSDDNRVVQAQPGDRVEVVVSNPIGTWCTWRVQDVRGASAAFLKDEWLHTQPAGMCGGSDLRRFVFEVNGRGQTTVVMVLDDPSPRTYQRFSFVVTV